MVQFLVNVLLGVLAGVITLAVLRSLWEVRKDGWRVLVAVVVGLIVFLCNFAALATQ